MLTLPGSGGHKNAYDAISRGGWDVGTTVGLDGTNTGRSFFGSTHTIYPC